MALVVYSEKHEPTRGTETVVQGWKFTTQT